MARTSTIDTPDELKNLFNKAFEKRDRFFLGALQGHKREPSRAQKKLLKRTAIINSPMEGRGSIFKYFSPYWHALSTAQKDVWKAGGVPSGLSGWQLFISDNAARVRNSLSFPVPPSELWQVRTGQIIIESPASSILMKQEHPLDYWISRKIPGKPWKQEPILLHESFSLPLELAIRYKSDLTPFGPEQIARFYAVVWTSYQGQDIENIIEIPFEESTDWTYEEADTTSLRGILIGYTLYIELVGYRGELLFDNVRAIHSGTNWARDPRCDFVNKEFKKAFSLVQSFWIPEDQGEGVSFSTVYPPAL